MPTPLMEPTPTSGVTPQLQGRLARFDDPWGVTWRVRNKIAGIDLRRSYRFQAARFRELDLHEPVFIIGAPRSGTTTLFRLLGAHPELHTLGHEGHDCWRRFHHPRRSGWDSDWVTAEDVSTRERSFVRRWFVARLGEGRMVEKTPENCWRIPYLLELFPDAHVVWLKRDPRAVVNSMLNGWRDPLGRFRTYYVPDRLAIGGYSHERRWCFGLVEGWRDLRSAPLSDVVAEQFRQYVAGALSGRELVADDRWHEVRFEDLIAAPSASTEALLGRLGLASAAPVLERAQRLPTAAENALGAVPSDWRHNADEVLPIVERVHDVIRASGYP